MQRQHVQPSNDLATAAGAGPATNEIAELRDKVATLEIELQRLRAERNGAPTGARDVGPARDAAPNAGSMSRRRLFGLLGGVAAAGAGLAVAGSALSDDRADAADGNNLVIGVINSNSSPGGPTTLDGSTTGGSPVFLVNNTGTSGAAIAAGNTNNDAVFAQVSGTGTAVFGLASGAGTGTGMFGTSTSGVGASGQSSSSHGVVGSSSTGTGVLGGSTSGNGVEASVVQQSGAPLKLDPFNVVGPPTAGAHTLGQFWVDSAGKLWQCVVAGTPGTWVNLTLGSKLVPVNPPARVLDTRSTGGPIGTNQTRAVTVAGLMGIPAGVSAVLTNLTATGANAAGFLAMFAHGTVWSGTSNLNLIPNQDLANNATSAVASNEVDVLCGGPVTSVNFIVDVFGYYL